jgi:hypothetical protein
MVVAVTVVLATLDARPAAVQLAGAIMIGGVIYAAAGWILKPRPVRDLLPQPSIEGA